MRQTSGHQSGNQGAMRLRRSKSQHRIGWCNYLKIGATCLGALSVLAAFVLSQPSEVSATEMPRCDAEHGTAADACTAHVAPRDYRDNYLIAIESLQPSRDSRTNATPAQSLLSSDRPAMAAPVARNDSYVTAFDTALSVTAASGVLANDLDADGDALTALLITGTVNGTLMLSGNGSFSYSPNPGFSGDDSFTYQADDGTDTSNVATVTITVAPPPPPPPPPNRPPVARNDSYATPFDAGLLVSAANGVLANDRDPDGDALTALLIAGAPNGTLALNRNGSFRYTPNPGFSGNDSFTYRANDGTTTSNTATVTITVAPEPPPPPPRPPTNTAPVVHDDSYRTTRGATLVVAAPGLLTNDEDKDGDSLTVWMGRRLPKHGTVVVNPDGSFRYVPNDGFTGKDKFTYRAFDGTEYSAKATVTIRVERSHNKRPKAGKDSYKTTMGTPLVVAAPGLLANDKDKDGDSLTARMGKRLARHGTVFLNADGSFRYVPKDGFSGTDKFTYRAFDGQEYSKAVTVKIKVKGPKKKRTKVSFD